MSDLDKRLSELEESHRTRIRRLSARSIAHRTLLHVLWKAMPKTDENEVNRAALDAIEAQFDSLQNEAADLASVDRDLLEMCKEEIRSFFGS